MPIFLNSKKEKLRTRCSERDDFLHFFQHAMTKLLENEEVLGGFSWLFFSSQTHLFIKKIWAIFRRVLLQHGVK